MKGRFLAQVRRVATYELRALFGSARAVTVLVLFLLVAVATSGTVASCQEKVAGAGPGVQMTGPGGQHAGQLPDNFLYKLVLNQTVAKGDPEFADFLADLPAFYLLYLLGCLFLYPYLLALLGYDQIAGDVMTGSAKFPLLRASRPALALGKVSAQVLLFMLITALNAGATLAMAAYKLPGFDLGEGASLLLRFWPPILASGLCYIGIVAFWSMVLSSPGGALGLSIVSPLVLWGVSKLSFFWSLGGGYRVLGFFGYLSPEAQSWDMARPLSSDLLLSLGTFVGFGVLFFLLGLRIFMRKDLP